MPDWHRSFVGKLESSLAKVIMSEELGLVVQTGDSTGFLNAIDHLATDPDLRCEIGQRARKYYLEHYSKEKGFQKWEQLIEDL